MAIEKKKLQLAGVDISPKTTLDNIVLDVTATGYTTSIASGGKIKADYVQSANGSSGAGIVYNNDSSRLTITNGGISVNAYGSDLTSATEADMEKIPTVAAVKAYVSAYVDSNALHYIPISTAVFVSDLEVNQTSSTDGNVHSGTLLYIPIDTAGHTTQE